MKYSRRCGTDMRLLLLISISVFSCLAITAQRYDGKGRRPFDDLSPIYLDLDGDRKSDSIRPRAYKIRRGRIHVNWIAFDAKLSSGRNLKGFFRYKYGTDDVNYWVYALRQIRDVNHDGKKDLLFYTGDDTSDETVVVVTKGNRYVVGSRRTSDADDWLRN